MENQTVAAVQQPMTSEHKKEKSSWMRIFRMVLILALVILLIVLVKNYVWPSTKEVSLKGGLFSTSEFDMTVLQFE